MLWQKGGFFSTQEMGFVAKYIFQPLSLSSCYVPGSTQPIELGAGWGWPPGQHSGPGG